MKRILAVASFALVLACDPRNPSAPPSVSARACPILPGFPKTPLERELEKINCSPLASLPPLSEYRNSRPDLVYQGEAAFLRPSNPSDGLFTFGAVDCSILIALSRFQGRVGTIAMAHIDNRTPEDSVHAFYDRFGKERPLDAYAISGGLGNALKVLRASRAAGVRIRFFNADLESGRADAALVDRAGRVYYGEDTDTLRSPLLADLFWEWTRIKQLLDLRDTDRNRLQFREAGPPAIIPERWRF